MEVQITRTVPIIVDTVSKNEYGDLLFKDKTGKDYKIGENKQKNRVQHFESAIQPNMGVELGYAMAYGREYIYSAVQVKDMIPPPVKTTTVPLPPETQKEITKAYQDATTKPAPDKPQTKSAPHEDKMSKDDWDEKDKRTRKSIERQKALDLAVQLAIQNQDIENIIKHAKRFEKYLEEGV